MVFQPVSESPGIPGTKKKMAQELSFPNSSFYYSERTDTVEQEEQRLLKFNKITSINS